MRMNPGVSNERCCSALWFTMNAATSASATNPSGMFRKKIQRQDENVVMNPPTGGPRTGATSPGVEMNCIMLTRSRLSVVRSTTSRPTGTIIAPPTPCTTRAAVNSQSVFDNPHRTEAAVKSAIALKKIVFEPKRSDIQPLEGMKIASVSRYADIPMLRLTGLSWNVCAICGSAVAITLPSSSSMKNAPATISAIRRWRYSGPK